MKAGGGSGGIQEDKYFDLIGLVWNFKENCRMRYFSFSYQLLISFPTYEVHMYL